MGNVLVSHYDDFFLLLLFVYLYLAIIFRRKGLECRRQFCEPIGAWFTQLGDLNTVYHMWAYP